MFKMNFKNCNIHTQMLIICCCMTDDFFSCTFLLFSYTMSIMNTNYFMTRKEKKQNKTGKRTMEKGCERK